ncbi:MAG: hypothetical protein J5802_02885 [Butyrivibrio sp.]|nr:hypothetical protein [Butyrivibrio sp.]
MLFYEAKRGNVLGAGRRYDAEDMNEFTDTLHSDFNRYNEEAKVLEEGYGRYRTNETFVGKMADASKEFINRRQTEDLHFHNLEFISEFLHTCYDIEGKFKEGVDPSPKARISETALLMIKKDQKAIENSIDTIGYEIECRIKRLIERHGKWGLYTQPTCGRMLMVIDDLVGSKGHIEECLTRLENFDNDACALLSRNDFKGNAQALQSKIINVAAGLDSMTVYTPCMAKNPINIIRKITNFFKKDKEKSTSDELKELQDEKITLKKMEKQEEQKIYAYIQKTYGYSADEMNYLKANHKDLLFSLYENSKNGSSDAKEICQQINQILDPTVNMTSTSKASYIRNAGIINDMETTNNGKFDAELKCVKKIYDENKDIYVAISQKTGVPPELICAIHFRESACDFNTHLHNGQPLGKPTTIVPKSVCFDNFEDAAVDALMNNKEKTGISFEGRVDDATCLAFAESFNGYGYSNNGHISPYLYSGTSAYTSGKYVSDHNFDPNAVDKQVGIYCVMQALEE